MRRYRMFGEMRLGVGAEKNRIRCTRRLTFVDAPFRRIFQSNSLLVEWCTCTNDRVRVTRL